MNTLKLSVLMILLAATSSAWARGGYIYEYAGDVKVAVAGGVPLPATNSMPLEDNTTVTTGERSRAVLKFEDGQLIVLRSNSSFRINKYQYNAERVENSNIFFSLLKGGLRAVTGLIGERNKQAFKLSTPNATIGIRGTDFMVELQAEIEAMLGQVTQGSVSMQTANSARQFNAGQTGLVASPSATPVLTSVPQTTFLQTQSTPIPSNNPAPTPVAGTAPPPPTAQALTAIAQAISAKFPGVTPADLAQAMILVGIQPSVVTVGIISFAPQAAVSVTTAAVNAAPDQAAEITTAAVTTAPDQAAAITAAAITAAPDQAVAITTAAVIAAPDQVDAITNAAVTAAPGQTAEILNAVQQALPSRSGPAAPGQGAPATSNSTIPVSRS
ncbi:MAG: FecR domain-containing protein [Gallionella sp.]|jgi:hypothetical protein